MIALAGEKKEGGDSNPTDDGSVACWARLGNRDVERGGKRQLDGSSEHKTARRAVPGEQRKSERGRVRNEHPASEDRAAQQKPCSVGDGGSQTARSLPSRGG